MDRGTFLQEFRVRDNGEGMSRLVADQRLDASSRAHRNSGLRDDHRWAVEMGADSSCRLLYCRQVRLTVGAGRRADCHEDDGRVSNRRAKIGCEVEASIAYVLFDEGRKTGIVERTLASREECDLFDILVHTDDDVASLRQTSCGNQPNTPSAEHRDA